MIFLYSESRSKALRIGEIKDYLEGKLSAEVTVCEAPLTETYAEELARIRVLDVYKAFIPNEPLPGEIDFERRVIRGEAYPYGVLYDGLRLQELYLSSLPKEVRNLKNMIVVFTDRFFGTYDEDDLRYHGRVILLGFPTVISLTGLVEAPAKPKEYYLARRLGGNAAEEFLHSMRDKCLDYEDERTSDVLKGYVMQGVFYHFLGEAFCSSKTCRLYNAHWQEELIEAQLSTPEFCRKHQDMLEVIRQRLKKFLRH